LTFQVKGAGGSSNEALRLNHDRLSADAFDALLDGWSGDPVTLAHDNHALAFEIH
jgi:hypothetical protein